MEHLAWEKTQRRFGCCTTWVRPCLPCGCPQADCQCGACYRPLDLFQFSKGKPISGILGVSIAGAEADLSQFRIDNDRFLVWEQPASGGGCCANGWPHQDLSKPVGGSGSWEVLIEYGEEPTPVILTAVRDMVCEQLKHCANLPCALPDNVESISEQGRTIRFRSDLDAANRSRSPSDTNSGVDSWDRMCELYGLDDDFGGPEFIGVPGGDRIRFVHGSTHIAQ